MAIIPAVCSRERCERTLDPHAARGMCALHYGRWLRHGDPGPAAPSVQRSHSEMCSVATCIEPFYSLSLCEGHHARLKAHGDVRAEIPLLSPERHGMSKMGIYGTWESMIQRCTNPKASGYQHYGGRGIRICTRWRDSFSAFHADMGDRPEGMSIERIKTDGDYEPGNCRWATQSEQMVNRRTQSKCGFRGVTAMRKHWQATIRRDGVRFYIGTFATAEEAAWMYDQFALAIWGENAILNFDYTRLIAS